MKYLFVLVGCAFIVATTAAAFGPSNGVPIVPYGQEAVSAAPQEGRITNGHPAAEGQFPYQVGLSLKKSVISTSWCGGSLISGTWVLTAAHCTIGVQEVTVFLGATVRTSPKTQYTIAASDVFTHEDYVPSTLTNDVALIRIPAVSYSQFIQAVQLPKISNVYATYAGNFAIASGWGRMSDTGSVATNLNYARLQVIPNSGCSSVYGNQVVTADTICVSTPKGTSTCQGDSGGPLVDESTHVLIGVTSFVASAGCTAGLPSGFARVTGFLHWIKRLTDLPL